MDIMFFGKLGEAIGREVRIDAPPSGCSVREVRGLLAALYPHSAEDLASPSLRACVDDSLVGENFPVPADGTVEFFPPLSGG